MPNDHHDENGKFSSAQSAVAKRMRGALKGRKNVERRSEVKVFAHARKPRKGGMSFEEMHKQAKTMGISHETMLKHAKEQASQYETGPKSWKHAAPRARAMVKWLSYK